MSPIERGHLGLISLEPQYHDYRALNKLSMFCGFGSVTRSFSKSKRVCKNRVRSNSRNVQFMTGTAWSTFERFTYSELGKIADDHGTRPSFFSP